jgi:hypothetical protein
MEKDKKITEAEKTLQVLEGIGKAEMNPFLFTKIMNRMEEADSIVKRFNFKLAITIVVVCLLTNFATIFFDSGSNSYDYSNYNNDNTDSTRIIQIKTLATEYSLTNNYYFY